MKNVYITTVPAYSKTIKETSASASATPKARASRMLVSMAVILSIFLMTSGIEVNAQNCPSSGTTILNANENTYYPGTQAVVATGATSITLGPIGAGANFGNTPIATGDIVLIIQMQGAQLFVPATKNLVTYGGNANVGSGMIAANLIAGYMEFAVATNAVPVGGGTLNISAGLTYNYAYAAYGATGQYTYQVIRVPQHFNIQLGATITTPQWNGSTGGVTVISAVNQLDFSGQTVNASGAGFRGGGGRALSGAAGTNKTDYYSLSTINAHASKAEGVAGTPRFITVNNALVDNGAANEGYPSGSYARGGAGNAGGGASDSRPANNDENAGGGGGGNGGMGGLGGNGWFSFGLSGGHGGTPLQTYGASPIYPVTTYYSPSRLIMGGGGGAGTTNDATGIPGGGAASGGATGGGMVIINSTIIIGTGNVVANGNTANSTITIDGSGGGGAGGSILIFANSGNAGITATANGGNGGSNNPLSLGATQHGPGGGGGGGVIYSNNALNVASTVTQGSTGISTGTTGTNSFGAADGFPGVLTQTFPFSQLPPKMQICQISVLPVTLLNFTASYIADNNVKVSWSTTNELNVDYFEVERSTDASGFVGVERVNADQSLNSIHSYNVNDQLFNINSNIVYYRLRIVDQNGKFSYSKTIAIKLEQPENVLSVFPNPLNDYTTLSIFATKPATGMLRLIDNSGKPLLIKSFNVSNGSNSILVDQLGNLPRGIYVIQVMLNNKLYNQKIVKK
jgi:hypothetical protein